MTIKKCIDEYTRIMGNLDETQEFREKLVEKCTEAAPRRTPVSKVAVATTAISGAAAATAFGVRLYRIYKSRN